MERRYGDCHGLRDDDVINMDYGNMENDVTRCVPFWVVNWVIYRDCIELCYLYETIL